MKRIGRWTGYLINEEKGGMLILVAVLMVVLLGMSALAVDAGSLYQTRREMVNAADATALAGAQEYYYDSNWANVKKYAEEFAYDNYGCDPLQEEVIVEAVGSNGVKVTTVRNVEYTFARFLGMTDSDVVATATAVFASVAHGNIIPIGMQESFFNSLPYEEEEDFVFFDDNPFGSGNWSWVYFDRNENKHTTVGYLEDGADASVGDPIWSNTGANIPTGNTKEDVARILQAYIDDETELLVPITADVVDMPEEGKKETVIVGFAMIILTDFDIDNPKEQKISGKIFGRLDAEEIAEHENGNRLAYSGVTLIE